MRISSTTLDMFVNRISDESFIERIVTPFTQTPQMAFGSAFDKCVSGEQPIELFGENHYRMDNIVVPVEPVEIMRKRLFNSSNFQIKATKLYNFDIEPVTLVAKVDVITGLFIDEIKTRFKPFSYDYYEKSYQWRCYLEVFNSPVIYYHVFKFNDNFEFEDALEPFYFNPYRNISSDVENALYDLTTFINRKDLTTYFKDL